MSARTHATLKKIFFGLAYGGLGFLINLWPLEIFPSIHLVFGSAVALFCAAYLGALGGATAGLVAGLRTWWLWGQPLPTSALLACGEAAFAGYFHKRGRRLLYATLAYWLFFGGWINIFAQHYLYGLPWPLSCALGLRSFVNGFFSALLAEVALLVINAASRKKHEATEPRLSHASAISFALMLGIFVPIAVAIIGLARYVQSEIVDSSRADAITRAASLRRVIGGRMETYRRMVQMTADLIRREGIELDDTPRLTRLIETVRRENPELAGMYVANLAGRTVAFSPPQNDRGESLVGLDYSDRQYYRDTLRAQRNVFSGIYLGRGGMNTPTAAITAPIFAKERDEMIGLVVAWYDLRPFYEIARAVTRNPFDRVLITDAEGLLVADSALPAERYLLPQSVADLPLYVQTVSAKSGAVEFSDERENASTVARRIGYRSWLAWETVPESGWKIIVQASLRPAEELIANLYLKALSILAGLALTAVFISNLIGRYLSFPLEALEKSALRLASGDLAARPSLSKMRTREAYRLTQAFARMADSIEQAWKEQQALTLRAKEAARQARERADWIAALDKVGQELSSTFDVTNICRAAKNYVLSQVPADNFIISNYDDVTEKITCTYAWVDDEERDPASFPPLFLSESVHSQAIRSRQPLIVGDFATENEGALTYYIGDDARRIRSVLYVPLIAFDRVAGTMQVQSAQPNRYSSADVEKLMPLASHIAIAISNARLFEQVQRGKVEWELTFDSMSDGIFIFNEEGRLIRANRVAAEMENSTVNALVGRRCCDVMSSGEGGPCLVAEAIAKGQRITCELRPARFDHPLLVTVEPLRAEGRILGAIAIARDLSELKRAEEEARTQRELVSQLIESAQEAICAIDAQGRTTWFNRRLCEATGYAADELLGGDLGSVVHHEDRPLIRHTAQRALGGQRDFCEARFLRKDGELRWFTASFSPVKINDQVSFALVVARDVTEERRIAEQMEQTSKLAAVGQLAAGVAHDFNNLLSVILGRVQLLKRKALDAKTRESLEIIERAALDGAATVRRLQNFARRRAEEAKEQVDIGRILQEVLELTRTRWRDDAMAKGIRYEIEVQATDGLIVSGVASELREVFTNLVINALDAMPDGGLLTIEARRMEDRAMLRFTDSGVGMTEEVRRRIFEPFFTTKGHAGTGLGLAISYGIIERHGGQIEVASEVGRGSVFTITLPLAKSASCAAAMERHERPARGICALVIDDEEAVRDTLAEMLTEMGHTVVKVESGADGLRWLERASFDAVFTDLSMPEMDGWAVARHIRARWPETKVLLVTGYGASLEPKGELAELVDAIISKPFAFDVIATALARLTNVQSEGVPH
ncbi:MAG: hypothetical protein C4334_07315 [Pyrinomonas sp.]|uniref:PAS domain S-box protein n=1 Tax=Pyrinomonas sp. TaxID=2080306 RepID=UPI0033342D09